MSHKLVSLYIGDGEYYTRTDADAVIAEKDAFIKTLGEGQADLAREIERLKQKLEDAKATAYAESVDAGMRERRLRRALWLTRGAVHKAKRLAMYGLLQAYPLWEGSPAGLEVHKKIFRYDGYERKCRAKAEEYK